MNGLSPFSSLTAEEYLGPLGEERNQLSLPGEASMAAFEDLCEEATCSICLEYFRDPVIIPECGHNFCRACLTQCWEKSEGEASCPQCRERVEQSSIRRNQQLANFVEIIKKFNHPQGEEKEKEGSVRKDQESPARAFVQSDTSSVVTRALRILAEKLGLQEEKQEEGKRRVCEKHQEPLKLFCKEDQSPICVVCDRSKEHKSHEVVPLEEASQEYKPNLDFVFFSGSDQQLKHRKGKPRPACKNHCYCFKMKKWYSLESISGGGMNMGYRKRFIFEWSDLPQSMNDHLKEGVGL
uniref:RING-type E3 ubiquitin transferase n=1 Tax=Podarcis muralis TaxID=64176 RepID=A0A670HXH7_PODMU